MSERIHALDRMSKATAKLAFLGSVMSLDGFEELTDYDGLHYIVKDAVDTLEEATQHL